MPMITAANAPYSPIPTQSPSPTTGNDYQNIAGATPEAFGSQIGTATSKLGATGEEAGNRLADRAIAQQQLANSIAANNSTNYFMDEANKILHGDPNKPGDVGFYGLKGLDAVNARQSTVQRIDALMQSARGQLTNQRQLLSFDSETRRQRSFLLNDVGRHYDQQLTQTAINSATASMTLAGQGMSVAAANQDINAFNHKIEDYMTGAIKHNQAIGGTQEMLDAEFQKIRGAATKQWVEGLIDKNPTQARDFLESNKDALLPNEYHQLQGMVRAGADKAEINRAVFGPPRGGMVSGGGAVGGHDIPGLYSLAVQAGYQPGQQAATAASIAMAESSGNPNAHNTKGEDSYGLMQLNADAHGDLARTFDPLENMRRSRVVSEGGTNWQPWSVYKNGSYKQFMPAALTAAASGTADKVVPVFDSADRAHNLTQVQYKEYLGLPENKQADYLNNLATASGAAPPPDVLINNRPLPMREATELPDAEIPGAYFPGGMTLTQKLQQMARDEPNENEHDQLMFAAKVKAARAYANGQYADQQHALKAHNDQVKAAGEAQKDSYIARIYPRDGRPTQVTETDIANDPKLSPEMKENIINFYRTATKPGPTAAVDSKTTAALFERIHADWGTPDKIVDMRPIDQAKGIDNTISKSSYDWLEKQVKDSRTAEGEELGARKKNLVETYKRAITKSNPMLGTTDDEGDVNYGRYQKYVDEQVEKRKAENKNPYDLFTEGGLDYLGRPAVLRMFQKPLQSSIKSITEQLQANPNYVPPGTAIPNVPPTLIMPRQPGETPADYLKRTGK